jgi:hypothetical protein
MTDVSTLRIWLEALKAARASGLLNVRHKDGEVTYRSDAELVRAIASIEAELSPQPRTLIVRANKGWE